MSTSELLVGQPEYFESQDQCVAQSKEAKIFDIDALTEIRDIKIITEEIKLHQQKSVHSFIEVGKLLNEAKAQLKRGQWLSWLQKNIQMSEIMAQRHMRLAREFPNPCPVTELGLSKAFIMLSVPPDEIEGFMNENHEIDGAIKTAKEMSKRELQHVIRTRRNAPKKYPNTGKSDDEFMFKPITKSKKKPFSDLKKKLGDNNIQSSQQGETDPLFLISNFEYMQNYLNDVLDNISEFEDLYEHAEIINFIRDFCEETLHRLTSAE